MPSFYTIKDIEDICTQRIIDVRQEGKWAVITLESGWRIKIKMWKA